MQYQQLQIQKFQHINMNQHIYHSHHLPLRISSKERINHQAQLEQSESEQKYNSRNYINTPSDKTGTNNVLNGATSLLTFQSNEDQIIPYNAVRNRNILPHFTNTGQSWFTEIFSWGSDQSGQLGLGQTLIGKSYPIPRFCTYNIGIKSVACGDEHTAFITTSNLIYAMGCNKHGQLGINQPEVKMKNSPVLIETLMDKKPIQIACGTSHTIVCTEEGDTYSWGEGINGALGIISTLDQHSPLYIKFPEKNTQIVSISCGCKHSAFIDSQNRLYTCGNGEAGQLGTGSREQENQPQLIKKFQEKIQQVSCGQLHTLVLTRSGRVLSFGANSFGQLGLGNKRNSNIPMMIEDISHIPMKSIAAGSFSASISHDAGDLYVWGSGVFGEFLTPHRVKTIHGQAVSISIGNHFGCAVNREGMLYTWGHNTSGELGHGDFEERPTPQIVLALQDRFITSISCGRNFTIALGQTINKEEKNKGSQVGSQGLGSAIQGSPDNYKTFQNQKQSQSFLNSMPSNKNIMSIHENEDSTFDLGTSILKSKKKSKSKGKQSNKKQKKGILTNSQYSSNNNTSMIQLSSKPRHKKNDSSDFSTNRFQQQQPYNHSEYTPLRASPTRAKSTTSGGVSQYHKNCCNPQQKNDCLNCSRNYGIVKVDSKIKTNQSKSKHKRNSSKENDSSNLTQRPMIIDNSQLLFQMDLNRQLRQDLELEHELLKQVRLEKQSFEDQLWREKNNQKAHELEIGDLRLQLKEALSQNSDLKNQMQQLERYKEDHERVLILEQELHQSKLQNQELNMYHRQNLQKIQDLELLLEKKRKEFTNNETILLQYGDNLKELELQFERRESEITNLRQQNLSLKDALDKERIANSNTHALQISYDEEIQRRKNCEREMEKLRDEVYQVQAEKSQSNENLKRAVDDISYQNEENMRLLRNKEEEINFLHKEVKLLKDQLQTTNTESDHLKDIIGDLEEKNRKLNEKLNEVIYNKASAYKQRTLQALKKGDSPERKERIAVYNIDQNDQDQRYESILKTENLNTDNDIQRILQRSPSPNRGDVTSNYKVYKELERLDLSTGKQQSPSIQDKYLHTSSRGPQLHLSELQIQKTEQYSPLRKQSNGSPLRNKNISINQSPKHLIKQQNQISHYQLPSQSQQNNTPNKVYQSNYNQILTQHQERVKNSCDKLASALGIQSLATSSGSGQPYQQQIKEFQCNNVEQTQNPQTSATHMTSGMIKKSLSELRSKLDNLKRDKEVVENGINEFESKKIYK